MRARLAKLWDTLRGSYWFLPTLMVSAAAVGAVAMVVIDQRYPVEWKGWAAWLLTGQISGGRAVLSTIASSMISVATLVFSITMVVLTLASSQFGPRLLRTFMRDRKNQAVLGTFLATFTYSVVVLKLIREAEGVVLPQLSILAGVFLALLSLGVLIYFIHHVAEAIQASVVIATVSNELKRLIDRTFPELEDETPKPEAEPSRLDAEAEREAEKALVEAATAEAEGELEILASSDGYLQAIDVTSLIETAVEEEVVLRLRRRPGEFVIRQTPLATVPKIPVPRIVAPRSAAPRVVEESLEEIDATRRRLVEKVNRACILGDRRTAFQDVEFNFDQLVEIAVRALSPGINDPYTACHCIDELGAALGRVLSRGEPERVRRDDEGTVRVLLDTTDFAGLADVAFLQIRQHGHGDVAVVLRLLETLAALLRLTRTEKQREVLWGHVESIRRAAKDAFTDRRDRKDLEERLDAAESARRRAAA